MQTIQPTKYLKRTTEFEYNGHELLIQINYSHSSHLDILRDNLFLYISHTLPLIRQWRLMIYIAIDNGSNNTVGGSCYFAHQAVSRFAEHHIDMISCVHRRCQTRAFVSGDVNESFECVTITDSRVSYKVLVRMTPKNTSINCVII